MWFLMFLDILYLKYKIKFFKKLWKKCLHYLPRFLQGRHFKKWRVQEKGSSYIFSLSVLLIFLERNSSLTLKKGSSFPSLFQVGLHVMLKSASDSENRVTAVISAHRMKLPEWEKSSRRRPAWELVLVSFFWSGNRWGRKTGLHCTFGMELLSLQRPQNNREGLGQPAVFNGIDWIILFKIISAPNGFNISFLLNLRDRIIVIPVEKSQCAHNFSTSWSTTVLLLVS